MKLKNITRYGLLFILLFSTKVFSKDYILINPNNVAIDETAFANSFTKAKTLFENEFRTRINTIVFSINPKGCYRTGYNPPQNQVVYCDTDKVVNSGLNSIDVFNHEVFHAFVCNYKPQLCSGVMKTYIHEAIADYFSFLLNPDKTFGEDFLVNTPGVRKYMTTWREGLVEADHLKGSILVTELILNRVPLSKVFRLFNRIEEPNEVIYSVDKLPYSHLNKYRLRVNEVTSFSFKFAPQSGVVRVGWNNSGEVKVANYSPTTVSLKITGPIKNTHIDFIYYSSDDSVLGFRRFYIGNEL